MSARSTVIILLLLLYSRCLDREKIITVLWKNLLYLNIIYPRRIKGLHTTDGVKWSVLEYRQNNILLYFNIIEIDDSVPNELQVLLLFENNIPLLLIIF